MGRGLFDTLLPILGGVAGTFVGGPIGGAIGSGLGSFAATGDVGKGIMSGIMGYGLGTAGELLGGGLGGVAGAGASAAEGAASAAAAAPQVGADSIEGIVGANSMPWVKGDLITPGQISGLNAGKTNMVGGYDLSGDSLWNTFGKNAMKTTLPIGMGLMSMMGGMGGSGSGQQPGGPPPYQGQTPDMNVRTGRRYLGPGTPDPRGYENHYFGYAGGGGVNGPGGGIDDAIPAIVNGRQPAALSDGEYVVPAHAVSALGNGSTDHGVRQLDGMVDNVMKTKYGTKNRKPRPINPARMMPGGQGARPFADGGMVRLMNGQATMADYLQAYAMLGNDRPRRDYGVMDRYQQPESQTMEMGVNEQPQRDYPVDDNEDLASARERISKMESGHNYRALGPNTGGDRAYGRYQVMGANVPSWTKAALGKEMTPDEFLANDQAQDAVFNHRFGGYMKKYGSAGASRAWFAGEGGMNNRGAKDVLGTSVDDYERRFAGR